MIDLERFVRSVVDVRNEGGGHGYDRGIRTFDCPLCGDDRGRGWVGVAGWGAGCWNAGCPAYPRLGGGAVEWARLALRLADRAAAWAHLQREFGGAGVVAWAPPAPRGSDFCRLPPGSRPVDGGELSRPFARFAASQWGVGLDDAAAWGLRWCLAGAHAFRVVVPVAMGGQLVGFQSRTVRGAEPKYLTSRWGPASDPTAECGRPAAAMLFNVDAARRGRDLVLVEGPGDVMGWHARRPLTPAVALLGQALTAEKLALLAELAPARVVVALDAEPEAQRRALSHVEDLRAWGLAACVGQWVGAKDAGAGAALEVGEAAADVATAVRARLSRSAGPGSDGP